MSFKFELSISLILSFIFLVGFSSVAFFVSANDILQFDRRIISFIQGLESPIMTKWMELITFIGSTRQVIIISILVMLFLFIVLKHRSELILMMVTIAGSALINQGLKHFFQRARPEFHRLIEIEGYSFPSGHAMNAFTVYGIITFLLWRHIHKRSGRIMLLLFSTLMILGIGMSRIYLGVHYPTDIIGGYLASGCWLTIVIWVYRRKRR